MIYIHRNHRENECKIEYAYKIEYEYKIEHEYKIEYENKFLNLRLLNGIVVKYMLRPYAPLAAKYTSNRNKHWNIKWMKIPSWR